MRGRKWNGKEKEKKELTPVNLIDGHKQAHISILASPATASLEPWNELCRQGSVVERLIDDMGGNLSASGAQLDQNGNPGKKQKGANHKLRQKDRSQRAWKLMGTEHTTKQNKTSTDGF
jgi:hypothetical protein